MYEITNVHVYTRSEDSYQESIVIPTPHGTHASICDITMGNNLFITCSQEESSFRIWDVSNQHVFCRMKIITPMNMNRFIPKCCAVSQDESILVMGYERHLTFWDMNGALVQTIPISSDYDYILTQDYNLILFLKSNDTIHEIICKNPFSQKIMWTLKERISSYYYYKQESKLLLSKYDDTTSTIIALNVYNGNAKSLSSRYYQQTYQDWVVDGRVSGMVMVKDGERDVLLVLVDDERVIAFSCFDDDTKTLQNDDKIKPILEEEKPKSAMALPTLSHTFRKEDDEQKELIQSWFTFEKDDEMEIAEKRDTFSLNASSYIETFLRDRSLM